MFDSSDDTPTKTLLDRRTYLKAAAGATAITAIGNSASAAEDDFDIVEVAAGEMRTIRLSDGETFENVLIDITNDRAAVRFIVDTDSDSTTTIRNVGIRGQFNHNDYSGNAIIVRARHPDGKIVFDGLYWADGVESNPSSNEDPSAVSVRPSHAGTVEFNRINLQGFPDNALYASPAGHQSDHPAGPANGGRVDVLNSYFKDNKVSDIRLGTDGVVKNCVCLDNAHRAFWANQHINDEGQYVIDSDFDAAGGRDLAIGNSNWDGGLQNWVDVENSRFDSGNVHLYNPGNELRGSPSGAARRRTPEDIGAPASAEEAAGGSAESAEDPEPSDGNSTLEVTSSNFAEYLLEIEAASVVPGANANTDDPEYTDRAFQHDGLWYVHGYTAGGTDDFGIEDGEILRIGRLQGSPQFDVDGMTLNTEEYDTIESVPTEEAARRTLEVAGQFEYRIEVSGEIRPSEEHAKWLSEGDAYGDDWAEWWLSGSDSARTVWEFTGDITNIEIADYDGETELRTLAVDGEELDHSEYVDTGPHALEVAGQFEYRVEVDGELWPAEEHAQWLTGGEAYGADWAEWWLSGSDEARTVWMFEGDITSFDVSDYDGVTDVRTLTVDGEEIDPDEYN